MFIITKVHIDAISDLLSVFALGILFCLQLSKGILLKFFTHNQACNKSWLDLVETCYLMLALPLLYYEPNNLLQF